MTMPLQWNSEDRLFCGDENCVVRRRGAKDGVPSDVKKKERWGSGGEAP